MKRLIFTLLLFVVSHVRAEGQGFTPTEALKRMQVPEGFRVRLVACEPMIRQPVTISFDDRGRIWVIQYLQYPNPAGLKPVVVDQYLRTAYDRLPEPPPRGPKGADRITILSDPDGDGHYRKAKDFVTGLNLASGMCLGHGGVFVLQAPYLLFYPDRDGNDVPDGDPEVLLTGFGMEDAHAVGNSLQWGPDGWLYGAQGSTVTAMIRNPADSAAPPIEFQQGIWRYHPLTKQFELFSEGGGNTWGLDFDRHGNIIAGTNYGGKAMLHQVQGAYYVKGFGKHGPLHNPHAYGYFEHVPYQNFKGGHVTCGGIIYQGGSYSREYDGVYIAANLLSNAVYWHTLKRQGSSFTAQHGGDFLVANDTWFRPIDCLTGPDGSVYIVDWYDRRTNHVDPVDNWDKTNGRIYKVEAVGTKRIPPLNLSSLSSVELVNLLSHPNNWFRATARQLLAERQDRRVLPMLRKNIDTDVGDLALESLWALYTTGGFKSDYVLKLLYHANEDVRAWTVRLLGDAGQIEPKLMQRIIELAARETSPVVRSQLACTCKRLPPGDFTFDLLARLLQHDEDVNDPHIPLLLWWGLENRAIDDRDRVLALMARREVRKSPIVQRFILERLMRRYASQRGDADQMAWATLLSQAGSSEELDVLLRGLEMGLVGRRLEKVPFSFHKQLMELEKASPDSLVLLRLGLRLNDASAFRRASAFLGDRKNSESDRASMVETFAETNKPECVPVLLNVWQTALTDMLRAAALSGLQNFNESTIAPAVLKSYFRLSASLKAQVQGFLCGRPTGAALLLTEIEAGRIAAKELPLNQLVRIMQLKDESLTKRVEKLYGKIGPATSGEKQARIASLNGILSKGKGDAEKGKLVFQKTCATCHTLFGEGKKIGPDLTTADRKNRGWLITNIVDPSLVIRPEYVTHSVETKDGRFVSGLLMESTPDFVTLLDANDVRTRIARDKIEELRAVPNSIMPEKLLDPLDDQQLRDLFAYLQGDR